MREGASDADAEGGRVHANVLPTSVAVIAVALKLYCEVEKPPSRRVIIVPALSMKPLRFFSSCLYVSLSVPTPPVGMIPSQGRNTPVISGDTFHVRRWPFCFKSNDDRWLHSGRRACVVFLINSIIHMITIVVALNSIAMNVFANCVP